MANAPLSVYELQQLADNEDIKQLLVLILITLAFQVVISGKNSYRLW